MKKLIVLALAAAIMAGGGTADAAKMWDDMSWWGNTGATPEPVQDPNRSGYWWWPTVPASNAADGELWGNRGIVYAQWQKPVDEPVAVAPPPVEEPQVTYTQPVLADILFDFDSAVLKPQGQEVVQQVAGHMNEWPTTTVTIVGHTCNIGTDAYNMGLGQRRADSVQSYLLQQGIGAARVSTLSKGESEPAVPNTTPDNRRLNRRVEFQFLLQQ